MNITVPSTTVHAPEPENRRTGVALCLSGGGFRAALFHLGSLRRLNELGILSTVDTISAVSGGSIVAAHLANYVEKWPEVGVTVPDWENKVAVPFRAFVGRNLRTWPLLKRFLLPWNWSKSTVAVETLAERYWQRLTRLRLGELPDRPRFIFSATDMTFGVNWVFEKRQVGDYQAGYLRPAPNWPVARAVAASSCFPPIFDPMRIPLAPNQLRQGRVTALHRDALSTSIYLTDGGVYDNMGLEPVWKTSAVILVSDGGAVFDFESSTNWLWRLLRYPTIIGNQAASIRKRWLISSFIKRETEGAYWGIGNATEDHNINTGYSRSLTQGIIRRVRTDMDAFTDAEAAVLENHGYLLTDAVIRQHVSHLAPTIVPSLNTPHPYWMDEERVKLALAKSHSRMLFGRW